MSPRIRTLSAVTAYILIFPPGNPPNPQAPRSAWIVSPVTYQSAYECARALDKSVADAIFQKLGATAIARAKSGLCILSQ